MAKDVILIADDAAINRSILREVFGNEFIILEAKDGSEAIALISKQPKKISVVLLDLVMPNMDGFDVLEYMNNTGLINHIPVILITGEGNTAKIEKAYSLGASDVIKKPFSIGITTRRTKNVISLYKEKNKTEDMLEEKELELMRTNEKVLKLNDFLVNALSSVVEFRDRESGEHVQRVKKFTKIMLKYLMTLYPKYGLTSEDANIIYYASSLHDLGKIAIPDNVLLKPGRLSKEEFEIIKKHPEYGCELLDRFKQENSKFYDQCYEICRHHHERYDGSGYPDGLKGDEIPISSQIISIVDVFDALVSKRVYKDAYTHEQAYDMIINGECGVFSPDILECFRHAKDELFHESTVLTKETAV